MVGGFTHSLFKVLRQQNQGLQLLDIITNEKFRIQKQESEILKGIDRGDYFQGFVLHLSQTSVLSKGLIFHPPNASPAILQTMKLMKRQQGWSPLGTLTKFARLQVKHYRLKHVDPRLVYSENNIKIQ